MSENIEGAAAKRAASGAGRSSGTFAGLVGYLLGRGRRGGKGSKKSGPQTAADWHNEEIAKRYDFGRENTRTLRDWQIDESKANTSFTREEGAKNNDFIRTRASNKDAATIRRGDWASAARTGARYSAGDIIINDGGGFSVSGPRQGSAPLKTPKPPTGRAGSARDAIAPSKSTVPKGKQFTPPAPAAPAAPARAPRGTSKPGGGKSALTGLDQPV
jgi:hypothetical protein